MRATLALAKKELASFFFAPMAYIVIAAFMVMNGFLFYAILAFLSQPGAASTSPMEIFFGGAFLFFVILMVPAITMRLGAEERSRGTLETLLTAPISDLEVVLGKYLAALALYAAAWLPTLLFVWVLEVYGEVDPGPVFSGYLGVFLVGALFLSIGLFTSFLSKNQLVAAILAFAALALLLYIPAVASVLSTDPTMKAILRYASFSEALQDFGRGLIDTRAIVFLVSGTAFFLSLARQALETRRWR